MATRPPPPRPSSSPLATWLSQAVAHHQAGRLDDAAALYRQIVAQSPGHFDATHLLGVLALQRGDLAAAEQLIVQALACKPREAAALSNLGTTLMRAGRLEEAREQFERAVKAKPADATAQANLGSVLRRLGRIEEALAPLKRAFAADARSADTAGLLGATLLDTGDVRAAQAVFESAAKLRPRDAQVWVNLAIAAQRNGQPVRALEAADTALQLAPEDPAALGQRGQALAERGQIEAARAAFARAVQLAPRNAAAQHNYGCFLREQGEYEAAVERLRTAIGLEPALAHAHEELVHTLTEAGRGDEASRQVHAFSGLQPDSAAARALVAADLFTRGRIEDAVEAYARAVATRGAQPSAWIGYGNALMAAGDTVSAARQFARALELDPNNAPARFSLAMSPLRSIYDDVAQMDASRRALARAVGELDAWFTPARAAEGARAIGSAQPFYLAYHPVDLRPTLAAYGQVVERIARTGLHTPRPRAAAPLAPLRARRLRVGIASSQVRSHSVWNAITQGWVLQHDPQRIELFIFQLERTSDAETARARRHAAHFVDAPTTLPAWTQAIVDAELDVLIYPEIGMHPLTTRLAAQRLAPVQATSWGQPITSGLPSLDLYLSAQALEPPQGSAHYTERLVALPGIGVCVQALAPPAVACDLGALGLSDTEPLLLCPGTPFKYTPQGDPVWAALAARLQARGGGRLVFFRSRASMSAQIERRMRAAFKAAGVDYDRTVAWIPTLERSRFFGLMQRATLMLDTIGFSGFNTALQGLECGLPVVAFEGEFMRGRLASGPLRLLGLDELVATNAAEFVDIALRVVEDTVLRLRLKREIVERRSRLFDDVASVRALEDALFAAVRAREGAPA